MAALARVLHESGESCRAISCEVVGHAGEAEHIIGLLERIDFQIVTKPDESEPCTVMRSLHPADLSEGMDAWILTCALPYNHPGDHMAAYEAKGTRNGK